MASSTSATSLLACSCTDVDDDVVVDAVVAVVVDVDDAGDVVDGVLLSTAADDDAELFFFLAMCARIRSLHRFTSLSLSSPWSSAVSSYLSLISTLAPCSSS